MGSLNKDTLQLIQETAIQSANAETLAHVLELPGYEYVIVSHQDGATIADPRAEAPSPRGHVLRGHTEVRDRGRRRLVQKEGDARSRLVSRSRCCRWRC